MIAQGLWQSSIPFLWTSSWSGGCPGTELPPCQPPAAPAGQKGALEEGAQFGALHMPRCQLIHQPMVLPLHGTSCIPTEPQHSWGLEGSLEVFWSQPTPSLTFGCPAELVF